MVSCAASLSTSPAFSSHRAARASRLHSILFVHTCAYVPPILPCPRQLTRSNHELRSNSTFHTYTNGRRTTSGPRRVDQEYQTGRGDHGERDGFRLQSVSGCVVPQGSRWNRSPAASTGALQ